MATVSRLTKVDRKRVERQGGSNHRRRECDRRIFAPPRPPRAPRWTTSSDSRPGSSTVRCIRPPCCSTQRSTIPTRPRRRQGGMDVSCTRTAEAATRRTRRGRQWRRPVGSAFVAGLRHCVVVAERVEQQLNDVLGVMLTSMVKERFIETYGSVVHTIGWGGSGGAISQYLIAHNYPGLLDGIIPTFKTGRDQRVQRDRRLPLVVQLHERCSRRFVGLYEPVSGVGLPRLDELSGVGVQFHEPDRRHHRLQPHRSAGDDLRSRHQSRRGALLGRR